MRPLKRGVGSRWNNAGVATSACALDLVRIERFERRPGEPRGVALRYGEQVCDDVERNLVRLVRLLTTALALGADRTATNVSFTWPTYISYPRVCVRGEMVWRR